MISTVHPCSDNQMFVTSPLADLPYKVAGSRGEQWNIAAEENSYLVLNNYKQTARRLSACVLLQTERASKPVVQQTPFPCQILWVN